jgi:hypothetical protein
VDWAGVEATVPQLLLKLDLLLSHINDHLDVACARAMGVVDPQAATQNASP